MNEPLLTGSNGNCLICGDLHWRLTVRSEDLEYYCQLRTWDLVQCAHCGHVYLHPLPELHEIASLYPSTYYTVNSKSPIYLDGKVVEQKLLQDAKHLKKLTQTILVRSVVDIGGGNLMRLVKVKEVFGSDIETICLDLQFDEAALKTAKSSQVKMVVGNVESDLSALRDEGHDLIVMRQLIEHLRDPRSALLGLYRKLSPNGLLIIDTPNRGGLDYHLFKKKYWGGYHIPRHFHLFTQPSLVKLLEETGYSVYLKGFTPSLAFWIISFRNWLGLNSIKRGKSFWEFFYLKNLPISGFFYLIDLFLIKLGFASSNQFIFAQKK
ncbi:MAG: class I SAM-dependent methyltransferase [Verrucomicrobiae bacterium]|nr:class I SAM-dependent methyltransferase [Verrucomicrobiae bacterium]